MTRVLRASTPDDLINAIPVVLGFHPVDSLVLLTFDAAETFHARVDLPSERDEYPELAACLVVPCLKHGVGRVVIVEYTDERGDFPEFLAEAMTQAGVQVIDVIHTINADRGDGRYGDTALGSRDDMRALLAPAEERVDVDSAAPLSVKAILEQLRSGTVTDPAGVLAGIRDIGTRDALLYSVTEPEVAQAFDVAWCEVVKVAPDVDRAGAAAVAAFLAWQHGHGAGAWVAIDEAQAAGGCRLAELLAEMQKRAVPPSMWREFTGGLS
jgi:hypothetical protein